MNPIRIILFVLLGYFARRLYLGWKSHRTAAGHHRPDPEQPSATGPMKDLTDQDIDDADFEEIP